MAKIWKWSRLIVQTVARKRSAFKVFSLYQLICIRSKIGLKGKTKIYSYMNTKNICCNPANWFVIRDQQVFVVYTYIHHIYNYIYSITSRIQSMYSCLDKIKTFNIQKFYSIYRFWTTAFPIDFPIHANNMYCIELI